MKWRRAHYLVQAYSSDLLHLTNSRHCKLKVQAFIGLGKSRAGTFFFYFQDWLFTCQAKPNQTQTKQDKKQTIRQWETAIWLSYEHSRIVKTEIIVTEIWNPLSTNIGLWVKGQIVRNLVNFRTLTALLSFFSTQCFLDVEYILHFHQKLQLKAHYVFLNL